MKKLLFSAAIAMSAIGICVANFNNASANVPAHRTSYVVRDTVPSDTTKPKDSTLLIRK